jgi:predicted GIY-YIG superfamily endonuclease
MCLLLGHRKPKWTVYEIGNADLREVYFGIAMNPMNGLRQHRQRRVPETAHWDFRNHRVRLVVLRSGLAKSMATATASGLQQVRYPGYRVRRAPFDPRHMRAGP